MSDFAFAAAHEIPCRITGKLVFVGHDWGGWIGFLLCLKAPERFEKYFAELEKKMGDVQFVDLECRQRRIGTRGQGGHDPGIHVGAVGLRGDVTECRERCGGHTRGRRLADGETEVKLHGAMVPVRAEIEQIESFSVHADADELIDWLKTASELPNQILVVHGEAGAAEAFSDRIKSQLGCKSHAPHDGEAVTL